MSFAATSQPTGLPRLNGKAPAFHMRKKHGRAQACRYWEHAADAVLNTPPMPNTTNFFACGCAHDRFVTRYGALPSRANDSLFAHLALVRHVEETLGVSIPLPIIEDIKMNLAGASGGAVRCELGWPQHSHRAMDVPAMTPFDRMGLEASIRRFTRHFHALMDTLPGAAACRAVHPPDLARAEQRLFGYLSGWLDPSLDIECHAPPMLRRRHPRAPIGVDTLRGWLLCFHRSRDEHVQDAELSHDVLPQI